MNICFICHGYPPERKVGGIESFTQTMAESLSILGNDVTVIGFSSKVTRLKVEYCKTIKIIRVPYLKRGLIPRMFRDRLNLEDVIRKELKQKKYDLIECPDVSGSLMFGKFGIPLIVRMHGANFVYFSITGRKPLRFTPLFEKRTLKLANHLVAVSRFIQEETLKRVNLDKSNCELIYNGIDLNLFKPNPEIVRKPFEILFVGRLTETKGAPNLFKALPQIFNLYPEAILRFIGLDPITKSGKRSSEELINSLLPNYRQKIEIAGELPHQSLPAEYQTAGVTVFPSRVEAHPISVLEAMACGSPVVFMKQGPGKEIIDDNIEGLLCDTESPKDIANSIIRIFSDPVFAKNLGENAYRKVYDKFNISDSINLNINFYSECCKHKVLDTQAI